MRPVLLAILALAAVPLGAKAAPRQDPDVFTDERDATLLRQLRGLD
jgi:hypothetical protein